MRFSEEIEKHMQERVLEIPTMEDVESVAGILSLLFFFRPKFKHEGYRYLKELTFNFPQRQKLLIPKGYVTLLFGNSEFTLTQFLHHLLESYQSQQIETPPILYIDTVRTSLQFGYFINYGVSTRQLKKIFFSKVINLQQFTTYIKHYLLTTIRKIKPEIIIIDYPFALIKRWVIREGDSPKIGKGKYFTGGDFLTDLGVIARITGTSIIVTSTGSVFDRWISQKIVPTIQTSAQANCHYRIHVSSLQRAFELEIHESLPGSHYMIEQSSTIIPRPRARIVPPVKILSSIHDNLFNTVDLTTLTPRRSFKEGALKLEDVLTTIPSESKYLNSFPKLSGIQEGTLKLDQKYSFFVFRFQGFIERDEVEYIRKKVTEPRDIDICLWINQNYSMYYKDFVSDLSPLEAYGGRAIQNGLFFNYRDSQDRIVLSFEELLSMLIKKGEIIK
jgi:hypothetical protein